MEARLIALLQIALRHSVSDIHLRLEEDAHMQIEMRVQGKIRRLRQQKEDIRLFRYLMYRANMDLTRLDKPQTGSFDIRVDGKIVVLRFASMSGWHMTSGVLRILNPVQNISLNSLADDDQTVVQLAQVTRHHDGLFLFSGPTGSGKTTTVYTLLHTVENRKIFTLEDPVEIYCGRFMQISINEKAGMTFANGIRQLMRHDPDIIMIGEIRDETAAAMAVRCALTGHLVLTTLHAYSCTGAILRMLDLDVDRSQLFDVLKGVSCQRLYTNEQKRKTGVYAYMNRKEILHYAATNHPPSTFVPLPRHIQSEVAAGHISMAQAQSDLIGE